MKKHISDYPDSYPDWYWTSGLHDACVVGVESFEFPADYNKFNGEKNKDNRNLLIFKVNAKGAIYDSFVKEIRFFNYDTLTQDVSLENRKQVWWLSDRLVEHGDHYTLEIDFQDLDSDPEDFTFKIKFERAEVDR